MYKIFTIAKREYLAAIQTKAFIISLVLMPVMMAASIGIQALVKKMDDKSEKTFVVVDRTPGAKLAAALLRDAEYYNQNLINDPESGEREHPAMKLEIVTPSADEPEAIKQQRYELSQRVEKGELEAFVDIGPDVYSLRSDPHPEKASDRQAVRYQSKKPNEGFIGRHLHIKVNEAVLRERFSAEKYDIAKVQALQQRVPMLSKGLTTKNAQTGEIEDAHEGKQIANMLLPGVLIGLMFMVIMFGATPAMQGIVEEKSQRIAEVLLGSVTPFQLMAGKLIGMLSVSLTTATIYFVGGYIVASRYGLTDNLTVSLIFWFFVLLVMALLIFGSIFIAIGAAAQDIKDTQTLLTPVMLFICLPLFLLGPILMDPHGKIAIAASLFPTSAPMILVARESVPPGVPLWQLLAGVAIVFATTLICVWSAGRIFRIGFLMQGKSAKLQDLAMWIIRG